MSGYLPSTTTEAQARTKRPRYTSCRTPNTPINAEATFTLKATLIPALSKKELTRLKRKCKRAGSAVITETNTQLEAAHKKAKAAVKAN